MPFEFKRLEIPDLILVKPKVFEDERGFFMETYKQSDFKKFGITKNFVQENHSLSSKGVLRGLHYQKEPYAQGKLVRVTRGEIFDAAVDIRRNSETFGKYVSTILSGKNKKMLYIPEGFAHGFCVLSDFSEVIYKTTDMYSPEHERGIIWNDGIININWPVKNPIISKKDAVFPELHNADINFQYK